MPLQDVEYVGGEYWRKQYVSSVTTPDYRQRRSDGTLPVNNFSWDRQEGWNPKSLTHQGFQQLGPHRQGFFHALRNGSMIGPFGNVKKVPKVDDLHILAEQRLATKVSQVTLEGGLNLAEYQRTAGFVQGAMVRTANALRALRRGDIQKVWRSFSNGRPPADVAADGWLAFTYGFRPLASDVARAVELLENGLVIAPTRTVKTHRTLAVNAIDAVRWDTGSDDMVLAGQVTYSGGVKYRVHDPVISTLAALGFTNPALILWELIPLSFVVDWFVPVNEWLHQFRAPDNVEFVSGWTYVKGDGECTWHQWRDVAEPGWRLRADTREILRDRRVLNSLPKPRLWLPNLELTKSQLVSGMALLQQATRRSSGGLSTLVRNPIL